MNHRSDITQQITRRRALAVDVSRNLWKPHRRNMTIDTKMRIYNTYVLSMLIINAETSALTATQTKRFSPNPGNTWFECNTLARATNEVVCRRSQQHALHCFGRLLQMPADHPLAQRRPTILAGTAEEDHEHDGRTRWEDVVNADLQELNIPRTEAETLAPDSRVSRRHIVSRAVATPHRHGSYAGKL